jgi:Ni/Co efflux regulator RcnB
MKSLSKWLSAAVAIAVFAGTVAAAQPEAAVEQDRQAAQQQDHDNHEEAPKLATSAHEHSQDADRHSKTRHVHSQK